MEIRPVSLNDCSGMAVLARELGYPSNSEKMSEILQMVLSNSAHQIFIAEIDQELVGYVHLVQADSAEDKQITEIAALLIGNNYRARGVGKAFVKQAEESAKTTNANSLSIRTNLISPKAFRFFEHCGFTHKPTQEIFVKDIE